MKENKYIFYCLDCGTWFKKMGKLITIKTDYGDREGIECPMCGGRAEAKGEPSALGGYSPNGIHESKVKEI